MSRRPGALAAVRELMARDRFAAANGVALVSVGRGRARTSMRVGRRHLNGVGTVQGGAIFTLADLAFAAACNSNGTVAVALDVAITFARPGLAGTLTADARQVSVSRRVSVCEIRVTDDGGELVALFRGTAFRKDEPVEALLRPRKRATSPPRKREPRAGGPR